VLYYFYTIIRQVSTTKKRRAKERFFTPLRFVQNDGVVIGQNQSEIRGMFIKSNVNAKSAGKIFICCGKIRVGGDVDFLQHPDLIHTKGVFAII
jgi:hypothetical protein